MEIHTKTVIIFVIRHKYNDNSTGLKRTLAPLLRLGIPFCIHSGLTLNLVKGGAQKC